MTSSSSCLCHDPKIHDEPSLGNFRCYPEAISFEDAKDTAPITLPATLDPATLVFQGKDGQPVTNSLKVAEAFGKEHRNVLQSIQAVECSKEFSALNFQPVGYVDAKGETRPMYIMTKEGFLFLVLGFTGSKAALLRETFIGAFNKTA